MRSFVSIILFIALVVPGRAQTPICTIQGGGTASAFNGQAVTTTGIVTALFSGSGTVQGFFIEDPACDANGNTSNGLFVYNPSTSGITVGDRVSVSGTVQEFQTLTELNSVTNIAIIGSGTVTPTSINLPVAAYSDWERFEGMLLRFTQTLVVTDNDNWAQYGELLMASSRLWQPTHDVDPNDTNPDGTTSTGNSNVAAINAAGYANTLASIILDDGRTSSYPDPPPLLGPEGTLRCGSTVNNLTGVLHYAYGEYRLHPVGVVPLVHDVRPAVPDLGGDLRIASYNVHNYWSTLGGFGAANSGELLRQRTKLAAALYNMNADAFMLCELQDNDVAWPDLLSALNALHGAPVYAGLEREEGFGTKPVIFYKTAVLTPVTDLYGLYTSTFERVHITQGFEVIATGGRFLLSSMHPHSKLCDNATGADLDQGDGQGCYNAHRRDQSQELVGHWAGVRAATGIDAQLIMGDFNSYYQEDPLDLMRANGLTSLVPDDAQNYTFRYGTLIGALDHAFGTPEMADAITGAEPWAINSDEPVALDYPDANIDFYQPNAFRSSDHDPLLVGVDASALVVGVNEAMDRAERVRFSYDVANHMARWEGEGTERIEVFDALGRTVISMSASESTRVVDLGALAAGSYAWRCMAKRSALGTGRFGVP